MNTVKKNDIEIILPDRLSASSKNFFTTSYKYWEYESFVVYDLFSDREKVAIDIGAWNGCSAVYLAHKNKHVLSYEPDPEAVKDFDALIEANSLHNVTLYKSPIYSSQKNVLFSPRKQDWNTSSAMIVDSHDDKQGISTMSQTVSDIGDQVSKVLPGGLDSDSVGLIKIDIEGGEEAIIKDLSQIDRNIPIYLSMHYEWWKDKSLDDSASFFARYKFLYVTSSYDDKNFNLFELISSDKIVEFVKNNPFASILMTQRECPEIIITEKFPRSMVASMSEYVRDLKKEVDIEKQIFSEKIEENKVIVNERDGRVQELLDDLKLLREQRIPKLLGELKILRHQRMVDLDQNRKNRLIIRSLSDDLSNGRIALDESFRQKEDILNSKPTKLGELVLRSTKSPFKMLTFPLNAKRVISEKSVARKPFVLTDKPLISVIITAYNASEYIADCLSSIQEQSYQNLEIIVIDDASADDTSEIVTSIASEDDRVKLISSPFNHGTYWSKNYAITFSKGDYIVTQDADDTCHPRRLESQLTSIAKNDGALVSFCDYVRVDNEGNWDLNRGLASRSALMGGMYHRSIFEKYGYFDSVRRGADAEMVERLACLIPEKIVQTKDQHYFLRSVKGSLTDTEVDFDTKEKKDRDISFLSDDRQGYVMEYRKAHEAKKDLFIPFPSRENIFKASSSAKTGIRDTKKIVGSVASYPKREDDFKKALKSILKQVDILYVYLNEYTTVPEWLEVDDQVKVVLGGSGDGNIKDNGKFYFLDEIEADYFFTFDDDIVYPDDYVAKMVAKMQFYGDRVCVGVHGIIIAEFPDRYFSEKRRVSHFRHEQIEDMPVNAIGTGTMAIPFKLMKKTFYKEIAQPGLTDIYFALYCKKMEVPIVSIQRPGLWLEPLDLEGGLFNISENDDTIHSKLVQSVEPWQVLDPLKSIK